VGYEAVPGLVETKEAYGETTLVVDPTRLVESCVQLRDEEGFAFLSDITATDYLGWGEKGVAGLALTAAGYIEKEDEPALNTFLRSLCFASLSAPPDEPAKREEA